MKVAICVDENNEEAQISEVFGRCKYFAIYDTESKKLEFIQNPGDGASRGAGISAGQILIDKDVEKLYCADIGPNAERILKHGNIKIEVIQGKSVEEIISEL